MTTYVVIINGQIDANSPGTTSLFAALRDNPTAIAEGDNAAPRLNPQILLTRDAKTANTAGGTFTADADLTRELTETPVNRISGASVASNQVTLPAGTYRIRASAPANSISQHKAWLYNVTDSAVVANCEGTSERAPSGSQTRSQIHGQFVLAAQKVLEIRHRGNSQQVTNGLGFPVNLNSMQEIYTIVEIEKVA